MAAVATIAIGVVFVLLIGEIDLSVAYVSAVGGVVMTLHAPTRRPGLAVVARDRVRAPLHDDDRPAPGARDHQGRRALVRGHARRFPHLVRRCADPDHAVLDGRDDPGAGPDRDRDHQRLHQRALGLDPCDRRRRRLRAAAVARCAWTPGGRPRGEADLSDRAPDPRPGRRHLRGRLVPEQGPRRPEGRASSSRSSSSSGRSSPRGRASGATSTRSAGTPRRRGAPESTSTACASRSS